jgi:hypothetical protein
VCAPTRPTGITSRTYGITSRTYALPSFSSRPLFFFFCHARLSRKYARADGGNKKKRAPVTEVRHVHARDGPAVGARELASSSCWRGRTWWCWWPAGLTTMQLLKPGCLEDSSCQLASALKKQIKSRVTAPVRCMRALTRNVSCPIQRSGTVHASDRSGELN